MKVIVGVDTEKAYLPSLQLFARLQFAAPEVTLAHFAFVSPWISTLPYEAMEGALMALDLLQAQKEIGREAVDLAKREAYLRKLNPKQELRMDTVAHGLSSLASETHADLIAIGAEHGSLLSPAFISSVSRALAVGDTPSLLVTKGPVEDIGPVKVVLATDHSEESRRWIERFLSWRPRGISEVLVVTAYHLDDREAETLSKNLPSLSGNVSDWISDHFAHLNADVLALLRANGHVARSEVRVGKANDVIRQAMKESGSDLLIVGAQGHGFFDRMFVGSTSLHQVVSEAYPVLVVRGQPPTP